MSKSIKELSDSFKALFSKPENVQFLKKIKAEIKFDSVKLGAQALTKDGKTFVTEADAWAAGVPVFTYDEATETATPVEDGSYELENGDTMVVEGGMVKEVIVPAAAEAQMSEEDIKTLAEQSQAAIEKCQELETENTTLKTEVENINKEVTALKAQLAKLKKAPVAYSVEKKLVIETEENAKPLTVKDKVLASMKKMGTNN
jgi:predicted RNase H-like nuclease (RuvC/YqgF family)